MSVRWGCLVVLVCVVWAPRVVQSQLHIDDAVLRIVERQYGIPARERVAGWGAMLVDERSAPDRADLVRLNRANDYFNQVQWLTDLAHWGEDDYWATPIETLASNGGDCEDFSIGKYFSLTRANVAEDKLRITYVKSLTYNQAHMVLAYYATPDAEPLILDNIDKSIVPASQRTDLLPIYSFSGRNIWLAKARGRQLNADSMVSLPQWKSVNERMGGEFTLRQALPSATRIEPLRLDDESVVEDSLSSPSP